MCWLLCAGLAELIEFSVLARRVNARGAKRATLRLGAPVPRTRNLHNQVDVIIDFEGYLAANLEQDLQKFGSAIHSPLSTIVHPGHSFVNHGKHEGNLLYRGKR